MSTSDDAYRNYMRTYMLRRRQQGRRRAIEELGGKCVRCGVTENLQIDHEDPATKEHLISGTYYDRSPMRVEAELAKCQLLCEECHKKKSAQEMSIWMSKPRGMTCKCGREFGKFAAYLGHQRWCS